MEQGGERTGTLISVSHWLLKCFMGVEVIQNLKLDLIEE
jgi:hypothetical protein